MGYQKEGDEMMTREKTRVKSHCLEPINRGLPCLLNAVFINEVVVIGSGSE